MTVAARVFNALPYVAALLLVALFLALGFWQLDRSQTKRALFAAYDAAAQSEPVELSSSQTETDYTTVRTYGHWLDHPPVWLENQIQDGRAGLHLYRAFAPRNGAPLLVNLGWLPAAPGNRLPSVAQPHGADSVQGLLRKPPQVGVRLGEIEIASAKAPIRTPYLDLERIAEAWGTTLAGRVLYATGSRPPFERQWRPAVAPPSRHVGYAIQWFALAGAVIATAFAVHLRARRSE